MVKTAESSVLENNPFAVNRLQDVTVARDVSIAKFTEKVRRTGHLQQDEAE